MYQEGINIRPCYNVKIVTKQKSQAVVLDFGNDEEEEGEKKKAEDKASDGTKSKEEKQEEQALPATEAPVIPDPVQSDKEGPAPTQLPVLKVVRATKPPPVKKIVKVEMPPLTNLVKASEAGGDKSDAQGLVCVVFETPALFPTDKTAEKKEAAKLGDKKKDATAITESKVSAT
jgi:hypothetical protein